MESSWGKRYDRKVELAGSVEEFAITKGNPYHDKSGRFTTGRGGGKAGGVRKGKNYLWETQRKVRKAEEALAAAKAISDAAVEAERIRTATPTTTTTKPAPKPKPAPTTTTTTTTVPTSLLTKAQSLVDAPASAISSDGQFWCADFIRFLTGVPMGDDPGPKDVLNSFPPTTNPQPGDGVLIDLFYGTDVGHDPTQPTHVAVITRITDTHVEVIEGNGASETHVTTNSYPLQAVTHYVTLPR